MKIYVDGACSPNPGRGRAVAIIEKTDYSSKVKLTKRLQDATNNIAEYNALILALEYIQSDVLRITMEKKPKKITRFTFFSFLKKRISRSLIFINFITCNYISKLTLRIFEDMILAWRQLNPRKSKRFFPKKY